MKNTNEYPTYMEVEFKNGVVNALNGKTFNKEGVVNVLSYVAKDAGMDSDTVISKVKELAINDGKIQIKLFKGAVTSC